jgi:hypothetical protein
MNEIVAILGFAVGTIFALSSLAKAAIPAASGFAKYPFVPARFARPITGVLVLVEATTAILILSGAWRQAGLLAGGFLLLAFGLATSIAAIRTPNRGLDCGCLGGALRIQIGRGASATNVVLGLSCLAAGLAPSGSTTLPSDYGVLEAAGALAGVVYWIFLYAWSVVRRSEAHGNVLFSGGAG